MLSENKKKRKILVFRLKGMKMRTGLIMLFIIIILLSCIVFLASLLLNTFKKEKEPIITNQMIIDKLLEISELSTVSLNYHGALRREEEGIKFLTQKSFVMFYDAEIKAGIDMTKAIVQVEERQFKIELPPAEILSFSIDVNSIEFFDEGFALFNWETKEDALSALQAAEIDAKEKINQSELLNQAYERAEMLIRNILETIDETYSNEQESYSITISKLHIDEE